MSTRALGRFLRRGPLAALASLMGAEIWEEGERRKIRFLESCGSLSGPTSSLNCLSCGSPYQRLHSLNALKKALFFTDFCFVASPSPNSVPISTLYFRQGVLDELADHIDVIIGTLARCFLQCPAGLATSEPA